MVAGIIEVENLGAKREELLSRRIFEQHTSSFENFCETRTKTSAEVYKDQRLKENALDSPSYGSKEHEPNSLSYRDETSSYIVLYILIP